MPRPVIAALVLAASPLFAQAPQEWTLETSTITYHVSHPLHQTEGVSHAARGKGICQRGECDFLIGAPVNSFGSGDSNRDLHMLQVTRGGEFPMVTVRTRVPQADSSLSTMNADLDITFAGQTAHYAQVPFSVTRAGDDFTISGTIPVTLSDFKIVPPALFGIAVKNDVPVRIEMTWGKVR